MPKKVIVVKKKEPTVMKPSCGWISMVGFPWIASESDGGKKYDPKPQRMSKV